MSNIVREFVFKVVLMGEGSVGKTSIRSKFMGVSFNSEYIKTIGADFASKAIVIKDNKVHFQIWDLAGQKMYRHVRSSFYNGCKCGFLVFDLTQPETLDKLEEWVDEAIEHSGGFLKIFIVVGNKVDLKDQIKVKDDDVQKLINKIKNEKNLDAAYIVTSAKTGENIHEAFEMMGKMFLEKEGFPRDGHGAEIDDELLERHHQEMLELLPVPDAQTQETETQESFSIENPEGINDDHKQEIIKNLNDKINRLTQITAALEERLLYVEAKKTTVDSKTPEEISKLKTKISNLEETLNTFQIAIDGSIEDVVKGGNNQPSDDTIPVPTIEEIKITSDEEEDTNFDSLDRSALATMEVINGDNDIESLTEILDETDKEIVRDSKIFSTQKQVEDTDSNLKGSQPRCPKCGSKLSFIKQYNRWYCYRCKIYV
ncbi:MAG: GTP-binding protein [Asgard group archaeon]|nr:GTP-binding protein [Asgard group archaeon]